MLESLRARALDYLESPKKIVYDKQKIIWVFPDNPKLKKLQETSVKLTQTHILAVAKLDVNSSDSKHLLSRPSPT